MRLVEILSQLGCFENESFIVLDSVGLSSMGIESAGFDSVGLGFGFITKNPDPNTFRIL